jgi:hypothetical protein
MPLLIFWVTQLKMPSQCRFLVLAAFIAFGGHIGGKASDLGLEK